MGYARLVLVLGALLLSSACAGQRIASAPGGPTVAPSRDPADRPVGPPATRPLPPVPRTSPTAPPTTGYEERGEASWYGNPYHGRRAASGEIYDMNQMTAAHRTLPFDTRVWVESLVDGTGVELRINDRGPFKDPERRIIDVSYAAARLLGMVGPGVIPVRLRVVSVPGGARSTPPPAPAAQSPTTGPAPAASPSAAPSVPMPESAPPISPPATPVASVREPTEDSPAFREAAAAAPETAAAPRDSLARSREAAASPREADAASREIRSGNREGWTLQLAAYSTEARAMAQRQDLARAWPGAHVQKGDVGGRPVWRVRVGRYPTRREAEEAAQRMAAAGHRAVVVEDAAP